jgi:hypothetical protein
MIKLPEWQFVQDDNGEWRWFRVSPDSVRAVSPSSFPDRMQCLLDALASVGLQGPPSVAASASAATAHPPLRLRLRHETPGDGDLPTRVVERPSCLLQRGEAARIAIARRVRAARTQQM